MDRTVGTVSQLRIHPLITLEICHQCLGRGMVMAIRKGQVVQEKCTNCAAKGTVVTDDSGWMPS